MASEKVIQQTLFPVNQIPNPLHLQGGARGQLASEGFTQLLSSLKSRPKTSQGTELHFERSPSIEPKQNELASASHEPSLSRKNEKDFDHPPSFSQATEKESSSYSDDTPEHSASDDIPESDLENTPVSNEKAETSSQPEEENHDKAERIKKEESAGSESSRSAIAEEDHSNTETPQNPQPTDDKITDATPKEMNAGTTESAPMNQFLEILNEIFSEIQNNGTIKISPELAEKIQSFLEKNQLTGNVNVSRELNVVTMPESALEALKSALTGLMNKLENIPKKTSGVFVKEAITDAVKQFKESILPDLKETSGAGATPAFEKLEKILNQFIKPEKIHKDMSDMNNKVMPDQAKSPVVPAEGQHMVNHPKDHNKAQTVLKEPDIQIQEIDQDKGIEPLKLRGTNLKQESQSTVMPQNVATAIKNIQGNVPQDIQINNLQTSQKIETPQVLKPDQPGSGLQDFKENSRPFHFDQSLPSASDKMTGSVRESPRWQSYFARAFGAESSVIEKITTQFKLLKSGTETSQMRFDLSPPELGKVRIELKNVGGVVSGKIQVENLVVKEMVESNLNQLRHNISAEMKLDKLEVEVRQEGKNTWQSMQADGGTQSNTRQSTQNDPKPQTFFGHYDWKEVDVPLWVPNGVYNVSGVLKVDVLG